MSGKRKHRERRLLRIYRDPVDNTVVLPNGRISDDDYGRVRLKQPELGLPVFSDLPVWPPRVGGY